MATDQFIILRRSAFVKAVTESLRHRCGVGAGDRILVAVSGGADSVALLRALHTIARQPHWQLDLHVGHVNHHLRDEAGDDERFVADLASALDLPFHRCDVHPAKAGGNLEADARRLRYAALEGIANGQGADYIATAHHADDQLETLLMRLIRGASVQGLTGIAPTRKLPGGLRLIRPMLDLDHGSATALLQQIDQPWREDVMNVTHGWRAKLRSSVLPVLRELRPQAAIKAAQTADRLRDAAGLLQRIARRAERRHVEKTHDTAVLPRLFARRLSAPVLGMIVRRQARRLGAPGDGLGSAAMDPIIHAARDASGEVRTFQLAGPVLVEITGDALTLRRPSPQP